MLEDKGLFFQRVSGRTGVFVAVDYGTRKLGFAVSDENRQVAFPKDVLIGNWRDFDAVFLYFRYFHSLKIESGYIFFNTVEFDRCTFFPEYTVAAAVFLMRTY